MVLLLITGIGCLALFGFQLTRARTVTVREREQALRSVRAHAGEVPLPAAESRRSLVRTRFAPFLASIHRKLWPKQTDDAIATELARAGASRRFTAELFMALRVALATAGIGRFVLGIVFAAAGILLPGFFLSKAAARRAEKIDMELPHFVDQLALIIEAGMGFDAAVSYLAGVSDGPLGEEMRRVLTELRV